jgi:hypothetical protein
MNQAKDLVIIIGVMLTFYGVLHIIDWYFLNFLGSCQP